MLTVKWHVISISKNQLKDIHDLLDASDLQMKQCVLASYASSLAAINEMESSLGVTNTVLVLDIYAAGEKNYTSFNRGNAFKRIVSNVNQMMVISILPKQKLMGQHSQ